jgi:AraC-like DNA-binding protein
MSYRELDPPAALGAWVECAWEVESDGRERRIVPDGCIDVVWTVDGTLQLVGANTTAFAVRSGAGARATGVRMHPGAAPALLGVDAERVVDARLPLSALLGDEARRLEERLAGEPADRRSRMLLGALGRRIAGAPEPDPLVRAAARELARRPERRTGPLARDLHVSERHLRRRVTKAVGYGPKRLGRVLRLQWTLALARSGAGLAAAGAEGGYADQAHFANDCVALTGVPPGRLLAN